MEELEDGPKELKGFKNPLGRTMILATQTPSRLPGTEPLTKGYTWFQPKIWQRNTLLGICKRNGLWSSKGSIEAPTKGNRWG